MANGGSKGNYWSLHEKKLHLIWNYSLRKRKGRIKLCISLNKIGERVF